MSPFLCLSHYMQEFASGERLPFAAVQPDAIAVNLRSMPPLPRGVWERTGWGSPGRLEYTAPILQMSATPPGFARPPEPPGSSPAEWWEREGDGVAVDATAVAARL